MTAPPTKPMGALGAAPRADGWLWLGTALAFSPALLELSAHWRAEAWARPSLLALYFVSRGAARLPGGRTRPALGLGALAAGLALEAAALAAGPPQLSRPGLGLGLLGMALYLGRPPLRLALLLLAVVPVPFALQRAFDPLLRPSLELPAAQLASLLGAPTAALTYGLEQGERTLLVYATDLGLPLAALLAAAAWGAAAVRRSPLPAACLASAGAAGAGIALQLAALVAAALVLAAAGEVPARRFLDLAPTLFGAAVALAGFELALRAARRPE